MFCLFSVICPVKPMSEKSIYSFVQSRELLSLRMQSGPCKEWFHEGGPKDFCPVGVNGDPTRYPADMHDRA